MGHGVGPRCPLPNRRSLHFLVHSTSLPRKRIATEPITDGDGIAHTTRLGRLRGSHLALVARRLDSPR